MGLCFCALVCSIVDPLPATAAEPARAGTLVSQEPLNGAPAGATAWKIRYRSIAENGTNVEISGVVFLPSSPSPHEGSDIVAWAHGTVGISETCQPSSNSKLFENIPDLQKMLEHGYIITATDFQGLGTPGPHPYLVGVSSGRAILDSVRAARALSSANASKRYVMWGESQGAHAALWAAQLATSYAPELDLVGIATAAPPTDLVANYKWPTSRLAHALITGLTTSSWSKIYKIPLSTFANPFGRYVIRKLSGDCLHREPATAFSNTVLLLFSNQVPYKLSKEWEDRLRQNSPAIVKYPAPVLMVQDRGDDVVPPTLTQDFAKKSCRAGNTLKYMQIEAGQHTEVATRSADATVQWIADRFDGKTAPSSCNAQGDSFK